MELRSSGGRRAHALIGSPTPAQAFSPQGDPMPYLPQYDAPTPSAKKRIYAAGKMMYFLHQKRDWRGLLRFKELEHSCAQPFGAKLQEIRALELDIAPSWTYVGPFAVHCPLHEHEVDWFYGLDDCPNLASVPLDQREFLYEERERQQLIECLYHQIDRCDVLYARVSSEKDCFSVFTEVGYALARGKRVYVDCEVETHDLWTMRLLAARSGATREEYVTIPWALYK